MFRQPDDGWMKRLALLMDDHAGFVAFGWVITWGIGIALGLTGAPMWIVLTPPIAYLLLGIAVAIYEEAYRRGFDDGSTRERGYWASQREAERELKEEHERVKRWRRANKDLVMAVITAENCGDEEAAALARAEADRSLAEFERDDVSGE